MAPNILTTKTLFRNPVPGQALAQTEPLSISTVGLTCTNGVCIRFTTDPVRVGTPGLSRNGLSLRMDSPFVGRLVQDPHGAITGLMSM